MSLLDELRTAGHDTDDVEPPWFTFRRALPLLVPRLEVTKMEVFSGGHVAVRAKSPLQGRGRFYVVAILDEVGKGLPDGRRKVTMGVARYRDEAEGMIFSRPFVGWIEPTPGGMACWMAGVLLTEGESSPNRAGKHETPRR